MAALGAAPATLAEAASRAAPPLEILPENWPALRLFVAVETQWRRAGMSGLATGLDYAVLPMAARALGVALTGELLRRLKVIEAEALGAMAERRG